jgi:hypothetical protein
MIDGVDACEHSCNDVSRVAGVEMA